MDQAEATRKKNEAQVEATRAQLDQMEADYESNINAAEAVAGSARMAVRNAQIELGYCRMYSPIDGRISRINFHVGNLVGDGQSSLLATIVKIDPIYAYTSVSEVRPDPVPVADRRGRPLGPRRNGDAHGAGPGRRTRLPSPGTVRLSGAGRRLRHGHRQAPRDFPQPRGAILPGFFVRVRIPAGGSRDALLVPERALGNDQSGPFLLVVGHDDVVEYRPVKAGARIDDMRVVEGKIGSEDRVVVEGLLRHAPAEGEPDPRAGRGEGPRGRDASPLNSVPWTTTCSRASSSSGRSSPTSSPS